MVAAVAADARRAAERAHSDIPKDAWAAVGAPAATWAALKAAPDLEAVLAVLLTSPVTHCAILFATPVIGVAWFMAAFSIALILAGARTAARVASALFGCSYPAWAAPWQAQSCRSEVTQTRTEGTRPHTPDCSDGTQLGTEDSAVSSVHAALALAASVQGCCDLAAAASEPALPASVRSTLPCSTVPFTCPSLESLVWSVKTHR